MRAAVSIFLARVVVEISRRALSARALVLHGRQVARRRSSLGGDFAAARRAGLWPSLGCSVYVRVLELDCVTCGAATWKNLKLETKGRSRFMPAHEHLVDVPVPSVGSCVHVPKKVTGVLLGACTRVVRCLRRQNRCCTVNLLVHVWRLHVYASNRTGKKQCSRKIAEFLSRVLLGVVR